MGSRRQTSWPRLGKPIERPFPRDNNDPQYEKWNDSFVREQQYQRMLKIKKYYGIKGDDLAWAPWYQLALVIASERDDGLKVVDYKRQNGRTTRKWRGAHGIQLYNEVAFLREKMPGKFEAVLAQVYEWRKNREKISYAHFRKNYFEAKKYVESTKSRHKSRRA